MGKTGGKAAVNGRKTDDSLEWKFANYIELFFEKRGMIRSRMHGASGEEIMILAIQVRDFCWRNLGTGGKDFVWRPIRKWQKTCSSSSRLMVHIISTLFLILLCFSPNKFSCEIFEPLYMCIIIGVMSPFLQGEVLELDFVRQIVGGEASTTGTVMFMISITHSWNVQIGLLCVFCPRRLMLMIP